MTTSECTTGEPASGRALVPPATPPAVAAPAGAGVFARLRGSGVQIYVCTTPAIAGASEAGRSGLAATPSWVLKAPEASLFDTSGIVVGSHAAGPTWTSADGSTVVRKKIAQVDAQDAQAVPWLLLRAASSKGRGIFSATTFIQRVNTVGGRAPAMGCGADSLGTERRVEYSADYVFYQGGEPPPVPGG